MPRPRKIERLTEIDEFACAERIVHLDAVRAAQRAMPSVAVLTGVTETFAALSDPTRLRIVAALANGELCVCDLSTAVGLSESAFSHQLRLLRRLEIVRSRRDGRRVYYALDDEHITTLIDQAVDHVGHRSAEVPA